MTSTMTSTMTNTTLDIGTTADRRVVAERERRPAARPAVDHVRLTGSGRVVVLLVVLAAALGVFAIRGAPAASTDVVHHPRTATVVVSPGETVWDIARRVAPESDPRTVVAEIEALNSVADAGSIRVGQPLFVPRS